MTSIADRIITQLNLEPHPEGGWYRRTWSGPLHGDRPIGTAILYLLKGGERSHWHRIDAEEIWLWHAGAPLRLSMGESRAMDHLLGPDVLAGHMPQLRVPTGWWQAAESYGDYTLVSCTVTPGFRFEGFELAAPGFHLPAA